VVIIRVDRTAHNLLHDLLDHLLASLLLRLRLWLAGLGRGRGRAFGFGDFTAGGGAVLDDDYLLPVLSTTRPRSAAGSVTSP